MSKRRKNVDLVRSVIESLDARHTRDIEQQNVICNMLQAQIDTRDALLRRIHRANQSGEMGGLIEALDDVRVILGESIEDNP